MSKPNPLGNDGFNTSSLLLLLEHRGGDAGRTHLTLLVIGLNELGAKAS